MKYQKLSHGAAAAAFILLLTAPPADAAPEPAPAPGDSTAAAAQDSGRQAKPRSGQSTSSGASSRSGARAPQAPRQAQPRSTGQQSGTRHPGADRDHGRVRGHRGHRSRYDDHATIYIGPYHYWPYGIWASGWPWYPWGWYGYGGYYGPAAYYPSRVRESMGALDLDLRPEEAAVFLEGQRIGIADNFDGWPRYLWLEEGTYDLVFHHEGYETLARTYTIYPGVVIEVNDRMVPGEARPAEELIAEAAARRRAEREAELEARRDRSEDGAEQPAPGWQERVRRERGLPPADADRERRGEPDAREDRGVYDARSEPVRLILEVEPRDAAVYLDGRFLGSAEELSRGGAAVMLDPGEHRVQIVRPGYATRTETVEGQAGDEVALEIELTPDN